MPDQQAARLGEVLRNWGNPPKELIDTLPKGGTQLQFLGHAATTRALIESDPLWNWEPVAFNEDGSPLIKQQGSRLVLWGRLTLHGVSRVCVGTCANTAFEPEKELLGDLLRNGAMRFGIALNLWAKGDWDLGSPGTVEQTAPLPAAVPAPVDASGPGSQPPGPDAPPDLLLVVEAARRQMTAAQKSAVREFMATNDIPSLAKATPEQLEQLADECERVLNGEPA
jgi:hypothetical protein